MREKYYINLQIGIMEIMNKIKIIFIILALLFIMPSVIYLAQSGTVMGFNTYYNFFLNDGSQKILSTIIYLAIFTSMTIIYIGFIKNSQFKNIKRLLIYIGIIGAMFMVMLPWTSSDIFYYMGVGELDSVYNQNPYYVSMSEYFENNNIQDEILEQGAENGWADTTVVYGPTAQLIFAILTKISFKNINLCLILFKLVNLFLHMLNTYLIYKITKKIKFSVIYGLNPFMFLEFIGNVHNDVIVVTFILLAIFFLLRKKNILLSLVFLAAATGMKYFAILLLPIIVLCYCKDEKNVGKRFLKCIKYGIIFLAIIVLEYLIYYRDISIFMAGLAQNSKLCKSIYSSIYVILANKNIEDLMLIISKIRNIVLGIFGALYIKFCIDLLTTQNIKFREKIRKYNYLLILFLLCLTTFQQWYLIWLFATIMWQKPDMIRDINMAVIGAEIANSVYMFKYESFRFDPYFLLIIVISVAIGQIIKQRKMCCTSRLTMCIT